MNTTTHERVVIELPEAFRSAFPGSAQKAGENRLQRAAQLALSGAVQSTPDPQIYYVKSQSNARGRYRIDTSARTCTCPDAGRGRTCKHRIAVWMSQQLPPAEEPAGEPYKHPYRPGVLRYCHPNTGNRLVKVLASDPFPHRYNQIPMVNVEALSHRPFADGLLQSATYTTFADRFTPVDFAAPTPADIDAMFTLVEQQLKEEPQAAPAPVAIQTRQPAPAAVDPDDFRPW
jgi:hypothetical protein